MPELLEPLFLEYGVKPTYLVSSEVMQNAKSVKVLKQLKSDHELGTHGHGELMEEGIQLNNFCGLLHKDFICEYPNEKQYSKLSWLTQLFSDTFGYAPKSFRAGRFGIDSHSLEILANLNYEVDSSVTPGLYHRGFNKIVNYIMAPEQPYRPASHDANRKGDLRLFEVPVSCWTDNFLAKAFDSYLVSRLESSHPIPLTFERVLRRTIGRIKWLRPTIGNYSSMIKMSEQYLKRNSKEPIICANIMFHPIELVIGASPYSSNQHEVNRILNNLEVLINYFAQAGCTFVKLKDVPHFILSNRQ